MSCSVAITGVNVLREMRKEMFRFTSGVMCSSGVVTGKYALCVLAFVVGGGMCFVYNPRSFAVLYEGNL